MPKAATRSSDDSSAISKALLELVSRIPVSNEPVCTSPRRRANTIARGTAAKAAGISGALALPPGPFGMATILPDLLAIWRLQQSMVADIAAVYGKTARLEKEAMVYCLFKHGSAALLRDLVVRTGERVIVRRATLRSIQEILQKVGIRVTQRLIGKSVSRWVPVIGAVGVGAYTYYDTMQVANTAIDLFSLDLIVED